MAWKQLQSKTVYESRWMKVREDEVETEAGLRLTYGVVEKKAYPLVVPWDGEKFTLVGQYRYPIDYFSWEFPQGHFEHTNIEETVRTELREETGLSAKEITCIGSFALAPGHHTQICSVYLATGLTQGSPEREESEADMQVKLVTLSELEKMIIEGVIKDGPTIAAVGIMKMRGLAA